MLNHVILLGRVGKDPEVRPTAKGDPIANFTLATSKKWKNKQGEYQEDTQWHRITAFGRTAELVSQVLKKGSLVSVIGEIVYGEYTDKDGVNRKTCDIRISEFKAIPTGKTEKPEAEKTVADLEDSIPF